MPKTWLLLDVNYLCHRSYHAIKGLGFEGAGTGAIFGFLRDVLKLTEKFYTKDVVFCFDHGPSLRKKIEPGYKQKRKQHSDPEFAKAIRNVNDQIESLKVNILPRMGFRNILYNEGYEADDQIAGWCDWVVGGDIVMVSADQDLYQLLDRDLVQYNPSLHKTITAQSFTEKYGISPSQWVDVKALAGCQSDNIEGIPGVGEKRAIEYLTGKMKPGVVFDKIVYNNILWRRNIELVQLPFRGLPSIVWNEDKVTDKKWKDELRKLGITTLGDW